MDVLLWYLMGCISFCCIAALIGISLEGKSFNRGACPDCGQKLHYFTHDSHGCRGYICDSCGYSTWVSYDCVDKRFKEDSNG